MKVAANENEFGYRIAGPEDTPWLIFSYSLNTNFSTWNGQVERFSGSYRILRYNTNCHNGTNTQP
jgi:3-oxoadipate enol-lactonase